MSEIDSILGVDTELKLSTGTLINIRPLKTLELFKLLKIISASGARAVLQFRLDEASSVEDFMTRMLGLIMVSVPEAERETLDFLRCMVEPVGLIKPERNKQDQQKNQVLWNELTVALDNPEMEDTLSIIESIVQAEAGNIQSLGKRIARMMQTAFPNSKETNTETEGTTESIPEESSEDSLPSSILSPENTDTPETKS